MKEADTRSILRQSKLAEIPVPPLKNCTGLLVLSSQLRANLRYKRFEFVFQ